MDPIATTEEEEANSLAQLLRRHKEEKHDLQGQIMAMKRAVNNNDKKRKKDVTAEISRLENELEAKHKLELEEFRVQDDFVEPETSTQTQLSASKTSRAQRRRDKKAEQDAEREKAIADAALENLTGPRHLEQQTLTDVLLQKGLSVHEVPPDGDCLYNSFAHQLGLQGLKVNVAQLRAKTAEVLRCAPDEFRPFLTHPDSGDMLSDAEFDSYCHAVETTKCWGGQPEIRALSLAYRKAVEVVQADCAPLIIGEEFCDEHNRRVIITYHKHAYRLGEHYNSTKTHGLDGCDHSSKQS